MFAYSLDRTIVLISINVAFLAQQCQFTIVVDRITSLLKYPNAHIHIFHLPWRVMRPEDLAAGVAGLFVRLDEDVTLEGVVDLGASPVVLLPLTDAPLPLLPATLLETGTYQMAISR